MMQPALVPLDYDFPRTRYIYCRGCMGSVKFKIKSTRQNERRRTCWGRYRCAERHEIEVPLTRQDYETLKAMLL